MYDIEIAYSNWVFAVVFLIAIIFVVALYYRNYKVKKQIPKLLRYLLFFLRFLSVFTILFLLLEPSIQKSTDHIKKPSISFLIDQSESIKLGLERDSLFFKIEKLKSILKKEFNVKTKYFDKDIYLKTDSLFKGEFTNLSNPINYLINNERDENIVGAVLFSDGNHNLGESPLFVSSQAYFPIVTSNIGRLSPLKDISIYDINVDEKIELNQFLSIDILLELKKIDEKSIKVALYKNDKLLKTNTVLIHSKKEVSTDFKIKSTKIGYDKYEIKINPVEGEQNILNNNKVFYVETYKNQKKVVLLYEYASPDIRFFSELFENNPSIDFEFKSFNLFKQKSISKDEFYILYDLFTSEKSIKIQEVLTKKNIPYLMLIGQNSEENYLGLAKSDFGIKSLKEISTTISFDINKSFNLENISNQHIDNYTKINFIPINFNEENIATPIVFSNNLPVLLYRSYSTPHKILTSISKLWALKFNEHHQLENIFRKLIINSLQQNKNERIQLLYNKVISKGEPLIVSSKIFDNNNEFISGLDILCKVKNALNEEIIMHFNEEETKYSAIIKNLNEGNYDIEVSTKFNGKQLRRNGKFTVQKNFTELLISESDSITLKKIAKNSNGVYFPELNVLNISNYINHNFDKTSINDISVEKDLMINYWFLLLFVVFTMALEWVILKYYNI